MSKEKWILPEKFLKKMTVLKSQSLAQTLLLTPESTFSLSFIAHSTTSYLEASTPVLPWNPKFAFLGIGSKQAIASWRASIDSPLWFQVKRDAGSHWRNLFSSSPLLFEDHSTFLHAYEPYILQTSWDSHPRFDALLLLFLPVKFSFICQIQ